MTEEVKKVSFGFTKFSKQPASKFKRLKQENGVQYIDCVESNLIKVKGTDIKSEEEVTELVIPVRSNEKLLNTSTSKVGESVRKVDKKEDVQIQEGKCSSNVSESLDVIAAREILESLKEEKTTEEENVLTLHVTNNVDRIGVEKEPTSEDYDNVPVSQYGMAMLRGMGWNPEKGIGKNEKLVSTTVPVLRPKGMGLGADKLIASTVTASTNKQNEELKLVKGAYVLIIAGAHKDSYGQVEGMNDEQGRVIVKPALGKSNMSVNEYMVKPVSKDEYKRHSRVLNLSMYEKHKKKERQHESSDSKRKDRGEKSTESDSVSSSHFSKIKRTE